MSECRKRKTHMKCEPWEQNYSGQKGTQTHGEKQINLERTDDLKIAECLENIKVSVLLMLRVTMNKITPIKQDQKTRKKKNNIKTMEVEKCNYWNENKRKI